MKNEKAKLKLLLAFLVLVLIGVNYPLLDKLLTHWFVDYEVGIVERVIDGDTLVVNGTSVRLLGINTPEKGEPYFEEAKTFLENKTLGKLVKLVKGKEDIDKYQRKLRYLFIEGEQVNLEVVRNGFGNYYFPQGKDKYYTAFVDAWEACVAHKKHYCQNSLDQCGVCVKLKTLDVFSQRIVLENNCAFSCDLDGWHIKDEGRKKFVFEDFVFDREVEILVGEGVDSENRLFWRDEAYVWTKTGDTLFLRDDAGKLVLWWRY